MTVVASVLDALAYTTGLMRAGIINIENMYLIKSWGVTV